jgi:hypothetical protein
MSESNPPTTGTKVFLVVSVLIWLPYGLYCTFSPEYLADAAGVSAMTPTATTEIRAMYGGLQAAIGVMCAVSLVRPHYVGSALFSVSFLTGGLALARIFGFFMDDSGSTYTYGAIFFEAINTAIAVRLARPHFS